VVSGILGSADVEVAARRYGEKLMGVRSEE
jgi:hypothetical protein